MTTLLTKYDPPPKEKVVHVHHTLPKYPRTAGST
jgi:hypothetical protein